MPIIYAEGLFGTSLHLNFSFTVSALLKIFVRSRRDQEKKCRIGIRHIRNSVPKHVSDKNMRSILFGGAGFFVKLMPFSSVPSLEIYSSVNLGMPRNEHFLPRNNGNHSESIPRNFFGTKFPCQPYPPPPPPTASISNSIFRRGLFMWKIWQKLMPNLNIDKRSSLRAKLASFSNLEYCLF